MKHLLSFDVENWYDGNLHRRWTRTPGSDSGRLPKEVALVLESLARHETKATFFVLGSVAVSHPDLVRTIAGAGHEIGCHGWEHDLLRDLKAPDWLSALKKCRMLLQDLSGQPVLGHRAPSWSVDGRVPWAVDVLLQAGFAYDSSVFPMRTPLYGMPSSPTTPYWLASQSGDRILEFPPAVWRTPLLSVPYGGGTYWRVLPFWLIRGLLRRATAPVVTYLHPWELNSDPLALPPELPLLPRLVLRSGVSRARARMECLLSAHSFEPLATALGRRESDANLPTFVLVGD